MNDNQVGSLDMGKNRPDSLYRSTGSPEEMRLEEERLVIEGYTRVPAITPDEELLDGEYKWGEASKISSLFETEVVLTWRQPE